MSQYIKYSVSLFVKKKNDIKLKLKFDLLICISIVPAATSYIGLLPSILKLEQKYKSIRFLAAKHTYFIVFFLHTKISTDFSLLLAGLKMDHSDTPKSYQDL